jgi:hypothetical protein
MEPTEGTAPVAAGTTKREEAKGPQGVPATRALEQQSPSIAAEKSSVSEAADAPAR